MEPNQLLEPAFIEHAVNFTKAQGHDAAKHRIGLLTLIERRGDTLIIGRGTQLETRITKLPRGHLALDNQRVQQS